MGQQCSFTTHDRPEVSTSATQTELVGQATDGSASMTAVGDFPQSNRCALDGNPLHVAATPTHCSLRATAGQSGGIGEGKAVQPSLEPVVGCSTLDSAGIVRSASAGSLSDPRVGNDSKPVALALAGFRLKT